LVWLYETVAAFLSKQRSMRFMGTEFPSFPDTLVASAATRNTSLATKWINLACCSVQHCIRCQQRVRVNWLRTWCEPNMGWVETNTCTDCFRKQHSLSKSVTNNCSRWYSSGLLKALKLPDDELIQKDTWTTEETKWVKLGSQRLCKWGQWWFLTIPSSDTGGTCWTRHYTGAKYKVSEKSLCTFRKVNMG